MGTLPHLEAFLISDILDDCLKRIEVVGEVSLFSKNDLNEDDKNFTDAPDEDEPVSSEDDKNFLYSVKEVTPVEKLKLDRDCIRKALYEVGQEMMENKSYETLKKFNEKYKENRNEIQELHDRLSNQRQLIPKMKNDIEKSKVNTQKELDDVDDHISELNFEFQKLKAHFNMEKSYLKKECANNIEMATQICGSKKQKIQTSIHHLKSRIEYEAKGDEDITKYWKQEEKELLSVLDYWKAKFFDDQTHKEREIRTVQTYKACNLTKMAAVIQKLNQAEAVLKESEKEKEEEQKRMEHEKYRIEYAIEIQAWWRGTMVRKKLGPYAPPKKAQKKKKGKKGKKK